MVLTPEEVISKTFQPTRFAEGYNQDEVDDFLDEVVGTLRTLQQQIDDLEAKLKTSEAQVKELKAAPQQPQAQQSAAQAAVEGPSLEKEPAPASVPVEVEVVPTTTPSLGMVDLGLGDPSAASSDGASGAAGMLLLAQRLHDEHVRNGQNQRDQLVADARARADKLVHEAEEKRQTTLSTLELERDELQDFINGLRSHEQEYRTRLRSFLQAQLSDLEGQQSLEPADTIGR